MWSPIRIHACRTWARACTHTHVCSLSHKLTTQHWQIFFQNTLNQSKGNANFVYLFSHYTPICCHKCMNLCHIFIVSWHYGLPLHSSSSSDSWAFFNQWYILYTADCSKISLCMNCTEAYKCYHCWSPWSAKQFDFCPLFEHCNQHRQHISLPYPNAAHQLVSTCKIYPCDLHPVTLTCSTIILVYLYSGHFLTLPCTVQPRVTQYMPRNVLLLAIR